MSSHIRIITLSSIFIAVLFSSSKSSSSYTLQLQTQMNPASKKFNPLFLKNKFRSLAKLSMSTSSISSVSSSQKLVPRAAVSVVVKFRDDSEDLNHYVLVQRGKEPNKVRTWLKFTVRTLAVTCKWKIFLNVLSIIIYTGNVVSTWR